MSTSRIPADHGFDAHALDYVTRWDEDPIGAAFRRRVHERLSSQLTPGERVLDLGCGPGVDAAYLAHCGARVVAVDRSAGMRQQATQRCNGLDVEVGSVDLQDPDTIPTGPFGGVLMDFGVLNCVPMAPVAAALAQRVRPGGWLVAVPMTRPALAHWASLVLCGHPAEALRRATARTVDVQGHAVPVHFPSAVHACRTFTDAGFLLHHQEALGALLPAPGPATRRLHRWVPTLDRLERRLAHRRGVRHLGDHTLLVFRAP